ncbi:hypothetical protein BO70DRAFT_378619 [Aspergillus heteromorphus CBS 117.55]|uniref:Uncharacterized protein n=1 Tax=Aspergillus heteromorphus CBS 117.55 TaxID=1448321 RepID=A0A317WHX5_9EURO|nr:uncharacterized protein BO70DRAFT_378619 [Aspergillus heteromorphus CBS 117.55]PWY85889.1 hypothetical protein BO70DRAFT_378619 [Aspergillus heteromorphus CBS 117.55]
MVLGIAMMAAMLPTMVGLNEATQHTRDHETNRQQSSRKQRCHLVASCSLTQGTTAQREQIQNAKAFVGQDGRIYLTKSPTEGMTLFNGGFFAHPDFPPENTSGLVTITGEQPPTLRWVFLDKETNELRWGGRPDSEGQVCGPFDWTKDEQRVTLEGWEGWLAVRLPDGREEQQNEGIWRVYFDRNDDGADLPVGAQGLEIVLKRVAAES